MKTPREILLQQHQSASRKLDFIRAGVVAEIARSTPLETTSWRAWLWPSPQAWCGLAAAWMLILGMNLAAGKIRSGSVHVAVAISRQELRELREQQQMLTKLIAPAETAESEPPKPISAPRSERRRTVANG